MSTVFTSSGPNRQLSTWILSRLPLLALLIGLFGVFYHLGDFPLLSPDEGRNAEVAREMKVAGSWLVPTYDGATYLDKPAFFFKAAALSLAAFGDTEFAARLPSAVSAFLILIALYGFLRPIYGKTTASLSVMIVATAPLFMAFARIVIFDMMLALFVSLAILLVYWAEEAEGKARQSRYLLATLSAGIATLIKGPVGFLVPLLVSSAYLVVTGRGRHTRNFIRWPNVLLFLGVVLPWFVGLSLACPDFPYYGIMKESISRFTTTEFRRTQPPYYYLLIIAGCFFSWSAMLPSGLRLVVKARERLMRADWLFICWAIGVVIFFSVSKSKLPGYILTGVIAMGVLVARVFAVALETAEQEAQGLVRQGTLVFLVSLVLLFIPVAGVLWVPDAVPRPRWFNGDAQAHFGDLLPRLLLTLGITALAALLAAWKRSAVFSLIAFLLFPGLFLSLNFDFLPRHASLKSAASLVKTLPQDLPSDVELACLECLPHGLPFYAGKPVTVFTEDGRELTSNYVLFALKSGQPWPSHLIPKDRFEAYIAQRSHPILLLARRERLEALRRLGDQNAQKIALYPGDYAGVYLPVTGK